MQKFVLIPTLAVIMLLSACSKNARPSINIQSPKDGQVFTAPEVIHISIDMYDSDELAGESVLVTKVNPPYDTIINFTGNRRYLNSYHFIDSFISEPATQYRIVAGGGGHGRVTNERVFVSTN